MELNHEHESACEQYLLGELSEQEQAQLEEAYFADDALFERFLAVKEDLIDAYARGELKGEKRERFEQHFMASEPRRQRVEEARGFINAVTAASANAATSSADILVHSPDRWRRQLTPTPFMFRPWVWRGALAALVLVALAGSWVLIRRLQNQRAESERFQNAEAARRQRDEERGRAVAPPVNDNESTSTPATAPSSPSPDNTTQPKTANEQPSQPMPAHVASLFLSPFSPRDATASNSLKLSPQTRSVRLRLAFTGDGYRRYDVVLRTVDGEQLLSRQALKALSNSAGKSVTITLDPSIFRRQDYIISLSGLTDDGNLESIGDYYFRVESSAQPFTTPNHR